jgi:hypothetical protein
MTSSFRPPGHSANVATNVAFYDIGISSTTFGAGALA